MLVLTARRLERFSVCYTVTDLDAVSSVTFHTRYPLAPTIGSIPHLRLNGFFSSRTDETHLYTVSNQV